MNKPLSLVTLLAVAAGCGDDTGATSAEDLFSAEELETIRTLSPLPDVPPDPTNRYADDPDVATFGQKLYYTRMASAVKVTDASAPGAEGEVDSHSCAGCHEGSWMDDVRSQPGNVSIGIDYGTRNSPPIVNSAFYQWWYWEGRADALWNQAIGALQNPVQQAVSRLRLAHVMYDRHRDDYEALFEALDPALDAAAADADRFPATGGPKAKPEDPDGAWEAMAADDQKHVNTILVNFGKAVAAYERLLVSRDAPFDRFVAGDDAAITESAKRGLKLFIGKAACVECHSTPLFSDNEFHNIGVPQTGEHIPASDDGRYGGVAKILSNKFNVNSDWSDDKNTGKLDGLEQKDEQKGQFRTKHLRQIAETGPYMHTGGFATLKEVVELYNQGGGESGFDGDKDEKIQPLNLDAGEVDDLVAFLETLTGEAIAAELTEDTSEK